MATRSVLLAAWVTTDKPDSSTWPRGVLRGPRITHPFAAECDSVVISRQRRDLRVCLNFTPGLCLDLVNRHRGSAVGLRSRHAGGGATARDLDQDTLDP